MTLDIALFHLLNGLAGRSLVGDTIILFFASSLAVVVPALFVFFVARYAVAERLQIFAIAALSAIIARFGITELIRLIIHRPRPYLSLNAHNLFTDPAWSFPSGHATFFFALATAVFLYHKRWGIAFYVVATLISLGRVMAGVHYPSDVLGGAIIGLGTGYFVYYLAKHIFPSRLN